MSNARILIVEDDADVRLGYHVLLKANHYETVLAGDSVSAISAARQHQPDLIILDLGLPAGDGFLVLERLKTNINLSMVPVIVVSGRNISSSKARALEAGAIAFLQKPYESEELLAIIQQQLGQSEPLAPTG